MRSSVKPLIFGKFARSKAFVSLSALSIVLVSALPASATTSVSYNFNASGSLTADFNSYVQSGSVSQSSTGGISNSGAINAPGSANAVFASKTTYSMGPVNSAYTFTAFLQSIGNNGYSGVGFTALTPSVGNTGTIGSVFRPTDALGASFHGGGFVLHNGANTANGSWGFDNSGIVTIKRSSIGDLLNSGSPSSWYKIVLKVTRTAETKFTLRIEVWSANADGTLIRPAEADAIFEWRDVTNTALTSAPSISSYINFSGDRVRYFDNYQVALEGGSTIVSAGSPVVLTTTATNSAGVVSFSGNATGDGGSSITERGFVYSTSTEPTLANSKVSTGSGTGTFSGATARLANGTYYFRAYATNSVGTSYGSEVTVTIADGIAPPGTPGQPTVVAGDGQATVTVVAPGSGGTPTSYTVTASPGGRTCTVTGASGSCTVTGLTNGTAYTFTVTATNADGTSSASTASASVTPVSSTPAPSNTSSPEPTVATKAEIELGAIVGQPIEGSNVAINATGLKINAEYSLILRSTPQTLASGLTTSSTLSLTKQIPSGLEPGWHSLTFSSTSASGFPMVGVMYFEVSSTGTLLKTSASEPTSAMLARTGANTSGPAALSLLLLVTGSLMLLGTRARTPRQ